MKHREELRRLLQPLPEAFVHAGLKMIRVEESRSDLGGEVTTFVFENEHTSIQLELSIGEKVESMTSWIVKSGRSFHLQEYLNFKKRPDEYVKNFFNVGKEIYFKNLCALIQSEWGDIITGKKWEDIPRDWMGYK